MASAAVDSAGEDASKPGFPEATTKMTTNRLAKSPLPYPGSPSSTIDSRQPGAECHAASSVEGEKVSCAAIVAASSLVVSGTPTQASGCPPESTL